MPEQEQRYLLGIAYQAGRDDRISKGQDGARDFFTEEDLEKAAWAFMKSARDVGLFHLDSTTGRAEVVESYVWRGPAWDLPDGTTVRKGDWLIGVVCDEVAWDLVKSGKITGFSPQGQARRVRP